MGRFAAEMQVRPGSRLFWAAVALGAGLGGVLDGILLHRLLRVREQIPSGSLGDIPANPLWDGIFHALAWLLAAAGTWLVLRVVRRRGGVWRWRQFLGGALAGFGIFNIFDGVVNRWLLGIHQFRQGPDALAYDLAFLAVGILLLGAGWRLGAGMRAAEGNR